MGEGMTGQGQWGNCKGSTRRRTLSHQWSESRREGSPSGPRCEYILELVQFLWATGCGWGQPARKGLPRSSLSCGLEPSRAGQWQKRRNRALEQYSFYSAFQAEGRDLFSLC